MIYNDEINEIVTDYMDKYMSDIICVTDDYELYENYEMKKLKEVGDQFIVLFNSQVQHKTTKEMKDAVSIWIITNEDDSIDEISDACTDNENLLCTGFAK